MKSVKTNILPILSGALYGLSWPIAEWINLSFLAWFAFVPLLLFFERNSHKFWTCMVGGYGAMVLFCFIAAGWIFNFPQSVLEVALAFFLESVWFFFPFLIFYGLQRKFGFDQSLWLLPSIWMVWEWLYLSFEFTMGTHLSAYSQSGNLWLIQYIDLTGMWGLSFWLMLFNVLLFKAYKQTDYALNKAFYKKLLPIVGLMLGLPLCYGAWAYAKYSQNPSDQYAQVALVPTQFSADFLNNEDNHHAVVEQTLYRTDSLAFNILNTGQHADLYVWPETGISYQLGYSNLGPLLQKVVADWEGALLTGCKGVTETADSTDLRTHTSGVLISPYQKPAYHHKTILTPMQEGIPYHATLAKIPFLSIAEKDPRFIKAGTMHKPLTLNTAKNGLFRLGVSLCFEQWYPGHWAALARNGADFYAHLAGEGWYGDVGFKQFMANVSRMRCIENRKQAARSANVGLTLFIDQLGRSTAQSEVKTLETVTNKLYRSEITTFYASNPNWFPILGILWLIVFMAFLFKK